MFDSICNEIDYTDAIMMDDLYDSCNSIKKLINTINYSLAEFPPNLQLYFLLLTFDLLFNSGKDNTKTIDKILKTLDIQIIDLNVLITIIQVLYCTPAYSLYSYTDFYNASKTKFNEYGIDIEKLND